MAKGDLQITAPQQGIAQSPQIGFADSRNIDIYTVPGMAILSNILEKKSGTTVDAHVNWIVQDPDTPSNIFALDTNGVLYKSADTGATWAEVSDRGGAGQGLAVKWGYVFIAEATTMDVMKISDSSFTDNWGGLTMDTDALWHPMIVSKNDGKIYGGAGRYIFSIEQVDGQTFDPTSSATYTVTAQALDLPVGYRVKCLAELGNNLMIGTWQGTNVYDIRIADIFPWDRSAPSFGQPIQINTYGVHAMLNTGNTLIVLAGIDGTVYKSDGVVAVPIAQIPDQIASIRGGKYLEWYPNGIITYKDRVFFGVGGGGTSAIDGMGVYSLMQTSKGNIINIEHGISTGNYGASNVCKVSALLPTSRDTLLVGWRDNATYGIDKTTATSYAYSTDYSGYFTTALYTVGTNLQKKKFKELEFLLSRILRTGEGIKIEYRKDLSESFVEVKEFPFSGTDVGAVASDNVITSEPNDIKLGEQIQLKISLLGTATTTPEFKHLIMR